MTSDGQAAVRAGVANDTEARRLAVESDASVLVRAPAGSGKTELLVRRFLRLLATVEEPEQIVALTFSRKAATEVHQRLLEALSSAHGGEPGTPHERRRWELARAVLGQDGRRGWRLEETPHRLRVLTLDAMALQLVHRMPWTARAANALQPAEAAAQLYRAAARATLAGVLRGARTAPAGGRALLESMDAKVEAAERALAAMLERRDQWLGLLGAGHGAAELTALRQRIEADLGAVVEEALAGVREQLIALGGPELPAADHLGPWRECAERFVTAKGAPRKRIPGGAPISQAAAAALHQVRLLPEPPFTPAQWDAVAAALELLPRAAAALQAEFQSRGRCDFTEITLAAVAALGNSAEPTELAFALDGQLRHLFLDEFQDTSHAQFALLGALVREWSPGDGRSLFLVGDPMQSIYGWRNAEPGLMLATTRQAQFGPLPLLCLQLSSNHRSGQALVAWTNAVFSQLGAREDDPALGAAQFAPAIASAGEADSPVLHVLARAAAAEADCVAGIVQQELAERGESAEIAILVQNRTWAEAVVAALQRHGIHPAGIHLWPLMRPAAVRDLWALARAVRHGADRVAWLAVLRAPWCGLTLADLHALCGGDAGARDALIEARLRDSPALALLSVDGRERLARVAAPLLAVAAQRGRTHLASLTAWCWRALGGEALAGEHRAAALALLALMEQSPDTWEDELERSYAPPEADADARVKLMTLHQAKGLQFDCVILPGLARAPRNGDQAMLHCRLEPAQRGMGEHFLMAARPGVSCKDALYDFLASREQRRREQEQLRLLYVGCTRAKRRLHLVTDYRLNRQGDMMDPPRRAPLARLWRALEPAIRAGASAPAPPAGAPPDAVAAPPPPLWRVMPGWQPARRGDVAWSAPAAAPPPSAADPVGLATASADFERRVGIAVHGMLQEIAEGGELRWRPERLRLMLRRAGVTVAGLEAAERSAREALAATLADPQGQWILGPRSDAHCEWALAGWAGGGPRQAIVDRTFIENGTRWIVDYKTTAEHDGDREAFLASQAELHRGQLALYAELARGLGPEPVRCGLYFARLGVWREVEC